MNEIVVDSYMLFKNNALDHAKAKGSCRVRYAMEPLDKELEAEINRRSP